MRPNQPLLTGKLSWRILIISIFNLISISQCIPSLFAYVRDRTRTVAYIPAIGVVCVFILQIFFSQLAIINPLFNTQPLSMVQALICISAGIPVIVPTLLLNRFSPLA